MKIAIIYHSETGNTRKIAEFVADGACQAGAVEVKLMSLETVDAEFVSQSNVVIFGCPTYAGGLSWQMKQFLDITNLQFAGKLGGVFATENYLGGGADLAELEMLAAMLVRGMLVYSAGAAEGQPFTHFGAVAIKSGEASHQERAKIWGARMARKALELFQPGLS